jgi:DNA-binding IclR family transcriptional regulator
MKGTVENGARAGVKSVEQGARVLRALTACSGPMTLKSIALAARMPPSKAHRYLVSLIAAGLVDQHRDSGLYRLGPAALSMGLAALAQLDLVEQSSLIMQKLCEELNETVLLSVWGNNGPTIIKMLEPVRPVTVNVRVGFSLPLLSSATGLVFSAFLPFEQIETALRAELRQHEKGGRPGMPTDLQAARALMDEVRRRGVSRVKGALLAGVNSMGAPVFEHRGKLAGVITVLGAADQIDITWNGPVATILKGTAAGLSRRLGYVSAGD